MSNDDLGVQEKEREKLKERGVCVFVYLLKQSVRACVCVCVRYILLLRDYRLFRLPHASRKCL